MVVINHVAALEGTVEAPAFMRGEERFPDFLCSLVAPARFLRLSLTKAAYAVASSQRTGNPGLALAMLHLCPRYSKLGVFLHVAG